MKKLLTLALALLMIVSCFAFASCTKEPTAYELVSSAVEKSAALQNIELEQTVNMKMDMMDMMGMSVEVPITMTMKGKDINSENAVYYSLVNTTMMGMSVDSTVYIEGTDVYTLTMGEGFKMHLDSLEGEYDIAKDLTAVFSCPAESVFEGIEIVKNEDGTRSVSLVMTQDDYINSYRPYYDSLVGELGVGTDGVKISDIKVTVTVNKDGYVCGYKMSCVIDAKMNEMGMELDVKANVDTNITFVNIGGNVTITPPEGYKDFTEIPADSET